LRVPKRLPIYVIAGAADPVGENGEGVFRLLDAYDNVGLERVTDRLYPSARHELFNEINRDEVTRDLIDWLDDVVTESTSRMATSSQSHRRLWASPAVDG
jgi:alpha-beta hydrolase superfamily lysophospholipase